MLTLALLLDLSGTIIELRPSETPRAEAEVVMRNLPLNGPHDNGVYTLSLGELVVGVEFVWEFGPEGEDGLLVIPPDGMICEPLDCIMSPAEGFEGKVTLFPWEGM